MFCTKCGQSNDRNSTFCTKCGAALKSANQRTLQPSGTVPVFQDLTGQVIDGKYRIIAKIGTGGMGDVYRANRVIFGDDAAIKVLHLNQSQNSQAVERFLHEAKMSAKFKHHNAVSIYDIGTTPQGVPYLVMELVQGKNLRQLLREQKTVSLDLIVTIAMQTCSALDEAHRLGIIHRDIKPENIVLSKTATGWQVKVLDFGIAKVQGEINSNLTLPGNALGTPQYMSPEQCLGEQLDSRSDIYSFGIVLYEMLCGVVPFSAAVASAIVVQHVNQKPPPLSNHQADISTNINKVVLRALEKKREKRPQTAGTLAKEFLQAVTLEIKGEKPKTRKSTNVPIIKNKPTKEVPYPIPKPINTELESAKVKDSMPVQEFVTEVIKPIEAPKIEVAELVEPSKVEITKSVETIPEVILPHEPVSQNVQESEILLAELKETASDVIQNLPSNVEKVSENIEDVKPQEFYHLAETLLPAIIDNDVKPKIPSQNLLEKDVAEPSKSEIFPPIAEEKSVLPINNEIGVSISEREIKDFSTQPDNAQIDLATNETNVETGIVSVVDTPPEIVVKDKIKIEKETPIFSEITDLDPSAFQRNRLSLAAIAGVFIITLIGFSAWYFSGNKSLEENSAVTKENKITPEDMVYVPGGEFMMGNEKGDEYEKPVHKMTVKPFYIDIYEVTCTDYKKFIDATNYKQPRNWKTTDIPAGWEKRPVTAVNWDDANAYAKWAEKRLPTEAEWEFAARGTDGRLYPWGNEWQENMANANGASKEMKDFGSFQGKSPFGAFDMVGNAWEWTADDAKYYKDGKSILTATPSQKVIRGGFYGSIKVLPTTTLRGFWGARDEKDYGNSGFRCVRD
jgi:serine/threonine protein kinase/formylglycine-generating enzyme required for sulfatase activity